MVKPKTPKTLEELNNEIQNSIHTFLEDRREGGGFKREDLYIIIAELEFQKQWMLSLIVKQSKEIHPSNTGGN